METAFSAEQPENAFSPMEVSVEGRVTLSSASQSSKAPSPRVVTPSGTATAVKPVPAKALSPIAVI